MKKIIALMMVLFFGAFTITVSAQKTDTKTQEKKGGFAVGGYDNAKQTEQVTKKRSVNIEEAEKSVKEESIEVPPPPPVPEQSAAPAAAPKPAKDQKVIEKENRGNAYGKDKQGQEGKDFGQSRSQNAKEKQKDKKNDKSKGRR